ncbi:MAG TPA: YbaN family protein [Steroidobacteraceae bacterium]
MTNTPPPHWARVRALYPREHRSAIVRALFLVVGVLAFATGIAGIFLPLLPATPLLILAAACFARAYRPFHEWMLRHRWLGPMLHDWYVHRSLPYGTKVVAIVTMLVSFGISILFFVRPAWLKLLLALLALGLATWLYRIPSRPRPARD